MLYEELKRLSTWGERHRTLLARLTIVLVLTMVVDAIGTVAIYFLERGAQGTEITSIGDALFFTTVQLLTVSSQLKNPLTPWGRVADVVLEAWGVIVVAGISGSMAAFLLHDD